MRRGSAHTGSGTSAAGRFAGALLVGAALLVVFVAGASAAPPPQVRRDNGGGHWFRRVCAVPAAHHAAACGAQVVTSSAGSPLAGSSPPSGAYGPAQFHTGYNLPTTGSTKTIAIVDAYNDPNIWQDLQAYDSAYSASQPNLSDINLYSGSSMPSPWFRKVDENGGTSYPATDAGWSLEIALDVETAHEICQSCNILLVEASSAYFSDLGTAENWAASHGADVISNSWSGGEFSGEQAYDSYFNHGIVITASTGDSGYGVQYPAASPDVVAVGGTTLTLGSGNSYAGETAWVDGGSGCSRYEAKPAWQTDTGCSARTVADVSADADPNTGAAVYDSVPYSGQSGWFQVGGTSLSAPLVAAVYALSGNTTDGSAPYAKAGQLHDVTSGSNAHHCRPTYLCTAGPGYDGPTGLGTPNGVSAFQTSPASTADFSLSVSPLSATVNPGDPATTYTVAMTTTTTLPNSVAVTVSGAPTSTPGCTLTPTSPSCVISVATRSSTTAGTYNLTFTGTDSADSLTHTADATLTVSGFSVSATPSSQTVSQGNPATYTVSLASVGSFSDTVALSLSGLPSGTYSFSSLSLSGNASSTLNIDTSSLTGSYTLTITGTDKSDTSKTEPTTVTLQVNPPPSGDFSLSISPTNQVLHGGGTATYTITVTDLNGFNGSIAFTATGTTGASYDVQSNSPNSATLTVTAPPGHANYDFTVTGTSGTLSHTVSGSLKVR